MSSRKEGAQIADPAYRQRIAEAVAAGIVDYVLRGRPAVKATK
jgi:N-acetylmuramoyl-L-alanine amidase